MSFLHRFRPLPCCLLLAVVLAAPATAEVRVELGHEPIEPPTRTVAPLPGGLFPAASDKDATPHKDNEPSSEVWLLPYEVDGSAADGPTTLFSVRHADEVAPVLVTVEYLDELATEIDSEVISLEQEEIATRNLLLNPDVVDAGGPVRGFVRLTPTDDITVDSFRVDEGGNFATGSQGTSQSDFCYEWQARFLRFGVDDTEGTNLLFIVNGPSGTGEEDPPTLTGTIYDEDGNFVNTFSVFSNEWVFELNVIDDLVTQGGAEFGSLRLDITSLFDPPGVVFERHSAFGRFSVGSPSVCRTREQGPPV